MIATILQSSPSFNSVYYNEQKVKDGVASLLEIRNFGPIETLGYHSPTELTDYLKEYSSRNDRIKKPQLHIAISCKGKEMSEEELLSFAHEYLAEMGYENQGQPLLIYAHRDTDNNHLHIISSRVDPSGKKIDDHHERRKSQTVLEKLEKRNIKKKTKEDITAALGFNFRNISQFRAIMEAMNYECYVKDENVHIKKGGAVQDTLKLSIVNAAIQRNLLEPEYKLKPRYSQLWGIFKKYKNLNSSLSGFEKDLKKKFGLSLVFYGSKDSPYGYSVVDFNNKMVLEGGKIMKVKEMLSFLSPEEHLKQIENLIDLSFQENPFISTKELNQRLFKIGAYVRKNEIIVGNNKNAMKDIFTEQLKRNNQIQRLNSFKPTSEAERDIICKMAKFTDRELVQIHEFTGEDYAPSGLNELKEAYTKSNIDDRRAALEQAGFILMRKDNRLYAYNSKLSSIIDIHRAGLPVMSTDGILRMIREKLEAKPFTTTNTINKDLIVAGTVINKNEVVMGDKSFELDEDIVIQLKRNNVLAMIDCFCPKDNIERDILCEAFRFKEPELVKVTPKNPLAEESEKPKGIEDLNKILSLEDPMALLQGLENSDFTVVCKRGEHYAFSPKFKSIINLDREGCPVIEKTTAERIIVEILKNKPSITTYEMNRKLNRIGAEVKKGFLLMDEEKIELDSETVAQLELNDKIALINSFKPSTTQERNILCKIYTLPETEIDKIELISDEDYTPKGVKDLEEIFNIPNIVHRNHILQDGKYRIERYEGKTYAVNVSGRSIIDLERFVHKDMGYPDILETIQKCLYYDPYINTQDLNKELMAIGAYISANVIHFGDEEQPVPDNVKEQLKRNNMIDWLNCFNPTTEEERDVICKCCRFSEPELIRLDTHALSYYPNGWESLKNIIHQNSRKELLPAIEKAGFRLVIHNDTLYAVNFEKMSVINLQKVDLPIGLYSSLYKSAQGRSLPMPENNIQGKGSAQRLANGVKAALSARGSEANREWEVGKKRQNQDDPDQNKGYSY